MIRRFAIAAGFAILGAAGFTSQASAQVSPPVTFTTIVVAPCSFTGITPGTLAQRTPTTPYLEATAGISNLTTGTTGTASVTCAAGGTLSVNTPTVGAVPVGYTPTNLKAVAQIGSVQTEAGTGFTGNIQFATAPLVLPINTAQTVRVGMAAGNGATGATGALPSGSYTYNVTLTATSN
jgi:hypothetical protein